MKDLVVRAILQDRQGSALLLHVQLVVVVSHRVLQFVQRVNGRLTCRSRQLGGQLGGVDVAEDVRGTDPEHGHNQIHAHAIVGVREATVLLQEQVIGEPQALAEEVRGQFVLVPLRSTEVTSPQAIPHLVDVHHREGCGVGFRSALGEIAMRQVDEEEEDGAREEDG